MFEIIISYIILGCERNSWFALVPLLGVTTDYQSLVLLAEPQYGRHRLNIALIRDLSPGLRVLHSHWLIEIMVLP